MYILAIETTGAFASVVLAETDNRDGQVTDFRILGHVQGHDRFSHLQNLTPQIQQVLDENKLPLGDVAAIAVSQGPGSFTGIRIGVSTTRALAQVLGVPCIGVSSLEGLALRAWAKPLAGAAAESQANVAADDRTLVCPILDARRSQVYGGGYMHAAGTAADSAEFKEIIKAGPYTIVEFMEAIETAAQDGGFERVLFLGDGVDTCGEKITDTADGWNLGIDFAAEEIRYQDAATVARLGAENLAKGQTTEFADLQPQYMRIAEAERKLKEQQAKAKAEAAAQEAGK